MFTQKFDKYVCDGDSITCELGNLTIRAKVDRDYTYQIDDDDCHNPDQTVTGCDDEQQAKLMEARKAYFRNKWWYGIVILSAEIDGVEFLDFVDSLGGIEVNYPGSDNSYLWQVANEMLHQNEGTIKESAKALGQKLLAG